MKFKTKLVLLISLSLLASIAVTTIIALVGINNLNSAASDKLEKGLLEASKESYINYIQANAERTNVLLNQAVSEVEVLYGTAQALEDNREALKPLFDTAASLPFFKTQNDLKQDSATKAYQNVVNVNPNDCIDTDPKTTGVPTAIGLPNTIKKSTINCNKMITIVWPKQVNPDNSITPEVTNRLQQASLFDLIFPGVKDFGSDKTRVFFSGPPEADFWRSYPWYDFAAGIPNNKDYQTSNYWSYEPRKGLLDGWNKWIANPQTLASVEKATGTQVTVVPPYVSGTSNQVVFVMHHPIWDKTRTKVNGSIGVTLNKDQLTLLVQNLKVSNNGFAFLANADTNVLAIGEGGDKILGLKDLPSKNDYLASIQRKLTDSTIPTIAQLSLPQDDTVLTGERDINGKPYLVYLRRLKPLNVYTQGKGITSEYWTLGFVVSREEVLQIAKTTKQEISDKARDIFAFQLVAILATLAVVVGLVYLLSNRMTGSLVSLTKAATQIQQKNYDVHLNVQTKDEFGQLSDAFNGMALDIKQYTENLEDLVNKRTTQLEQANKEITSLNSLLKADNMRMSAELDITRRLQKMILPRDHELDEVSGLDIAGFMEPADEVGGDYYDVLQYNGQVMIGIGDVTGHGLESGVLMIMVQTAVRTMLANNESDPSKYLNVVNRTIYENVQRMDSDKNLTLSLLDYDKGTLRMSGQHEEMIVARANGNIERIDTMNLGFPVGLEEDIEAFVAYRDVQLEPGDVVVLYTDGIPEAENPAGELYGLERFCQIILDNHDGSARQIQLAIIEDLKRHIGTQKVFDDITLLVLKQKEALVPALV